jgi:hypothetical protein
MRGWIKILQTHGQWLAVGGSGGQWLARVSVIRPDDATL